MLNTEAGKPFSLRRSRQTNKNCDIMKEIQMKDFLSPSGTEVNIIPVLQGDGYMKIDEAELPDSLPILALRNAVLFPGTIYPITIGREKSIKLIEAMPISVQFLRTTFPSKIRKRKTCTNTAP